MSLLPVHGELYNHCLQWQARRGWSRGGGGGVGAGD